MKIPNLLFYVGKSSNKNTVIYEFKLHEDGSLNVLNPIEAYWIMRENNGEREELTFLEAKMAYGFNVESIEENEVIFSITPLKDQLLTIKKNSEGKYRAFIRLEENSIEYILKKVFVNLDEGTFSSEVESLTLYLENPDTGDIKKADLKNDE
jgi:hypothetical protein